MKTSNGYGRMEDLAGLAVVGVVNYLGALAIAVDPTLSVAAGNELATQVEAQLHEHLPFLKQVSVQIQPDAAPRKHS